MTIKEKDLILELGSEELPAGFIMPALKGLKQSIRKKLEQNRLSWSEVTTYGTPRRLTIIVRGLSVKQPDATITARGPNKKAAYDPDGNPTKALLGFARSQGIEPDKLTELKTDKGVYLQAVKKVTGRKTGEILPEILQAVSCSIAFPKVMRWGSRNITFARPLHWILSLYGSKVVNFDFDHIKSGATTQGHRFLNAKKAGHKINIKSAGEYLEKLREHCVIADPAERKAIITNGLEAEAAKAGGNLLPDPGLLDEVTYLVEYPVVVMGEFDPAFLKLPAEVIINAMREHQRYFSVVDKTGKLLPFFITVANTEAKVMDVVKKGNERVLQARLDDAKFYFENDVKTPLSDFVEDLKGVIFQSKLGTSYEKMERFSRLAFFIGSELNFSAPLGDHENLSDFLLKDNYDPKTIRKDTVTPLIYNKFVLGRAARLAKADLVSGMVGEFPKLQGIMGGEYARLAGEVPEVCEAIEEHYMPIAAGSELPHSGASSIVSIADKLDTIAGCFGVGLIPTGTADPYALRRSALGIIRIIIDNNFRLPINDAVDSALDNLEARLSRPRQEVKTDIMDFFKERLRNQLLSGGLSFDSIDAVLSVAWSDMTDAVKRVQALEGFKKHPSCQSLVIAFKRVANILKGTDLVGAPQEELFTDDAERVLWQTAREISPVILENLDNGNYDKVFETLASIKNSIDTFFNDVMVMVDDETQRINRLKLLNAVKSLYFQIADLSKLSM